MRVCWLRVCVLVCVCLFVSVVLYVCVRLIMCEFGSVRGCVAVHLYVCVCASAFGCATVCLRVWLFVYDVHWLRAVASLSFASL